MFSPHVCAHSFWLKYIEHINIWKWSWNLFSLKYWVFFLEYYQNEWNFRPLFVSSLIFDVNKAFSKSVSSFPDSNQANWFISIVFFCCLPLRASFVCVFMKREMKMWSVISSQLDTNYIICLIRAIWWIGSNWKYIVLFSTKTTNFFLLNVAYNRSTTDLWLFTLLFIGVFFVSLASPVVIVRRSAHFINRRFRERANVCLQIRNIEIHVERSCFQMRSRVDAKYVFEILRKFGETVPLWFWSV